MSNAYEHPEFGHDAASKSAGYAQLDAALAALLAGEHDLIANLANHAADGVVPVRGSAPAAFAGLAPPDAVFIGGISHEVVRLIEPVWAVLKPGGTLVAHLGSIEGVASVQAKLRSHSEQVDLVQIMLARGVDQLGTTRLDPLSPSFILRAGR